MNVPGRIETLAPVRGTRAGNTVAFTGIKRALTPTRGARAANPGAYAGILRTLTLLRGTNTSPPTVFLGRAVAFGKAAFVGPFQPGTANATFAMIPPFFARAAARARAAITGRHADAAVTETGAHAAVTETRARGTVTRR